MFVWLFLCVVSCLCGFLFLWVLVSLFVCVFLWLLVCLCGCLFVWFFDSSGVCLPVCVFVCLLLCFLVRSLRSPPLLVGTSPLLQSRVPVLVIRPAVCSNRLREYAELMMVQQTELRKIVLAIVPNFVIRAARKHAWKMLPQNVFMMQDTTYYGEPYEGLATKLRGPSAPMTAATSTT